jgi:hypothetical protein
MMSDSIRDKRTLMLITSVPAFAVVAAVAYWAPLLFRFVTLPSDDASARLIFAVQCLLGPACMLWAGVQFAGRRFLYPDAIDGTRTPANRGLEINLRYNLNTLEQLVLAAVAWSNLALVLSHDRLVLIPAMATLFVIGRITFWIGYLWRPVARAFGMILTALPTAVTYVWLLAYWIHRAA